jgi:hypothetical protein
VADIAPTKMSLVNRPGTASKQIEQPWELRQQTAIRGTCHFGKRSFQRLH